MMQRKELLLNSGWMLKDEPISAKKEVYNKVIKKKKWMHAEVPGDVRLDLMREGSISEPNVGMNAMDSEWVEEKSWWYKNEFSVPAGWKKYERIELFCESLDIGADIFLNGEEIGFHPTSYRPFIKNIKPLLMFGKNRKNLLVIRLTTGNLDLPEDIQKFAREFNPPREKSAAPHRYDATHPFLRKPASVWGWDWAGRVATCGIYGPVRLIPREQTHISEVYVRTKQVQQKKAEIDVTVGLYNNSYFSDCRVAVHTTILDGKSKLFQKIQHLDLISGYNRIELNFEIPDPKLWWPAGAGKQHLYSVSVKLYDDAGEIDEYKGSFGVKSVRIEQQKLNEKERKFTFHINGKPVFCKGANWVPADSFPVRITSEKYETLISEAAAAGFNMLRIWGGGLYEPDIFYELCDRYGLLVWHDFMFACAAYPEHDDFKHEIEKEAEYQIKRLRNHPCIVLWCGSNENNWGALSWGGWDITKEWGASIYSDILTRAVALHDPATPYWTSSPWGGETPNSEHAGDMHCWQWAWNPDIKKRINPELFDGLKTKFASEYGHIGPPVKESVLQYLGDEKHYSLDDPVFREHINIFGRTPDTVKIGINEFYRNPESISVDDYLYYGGLVQGTLYGHTLESFRYRRNECSGVLFWMYNDCWGEIGWTIMDYYLRRKISWYFVKRAFSPVRIIIRKDHDKANIRIINDSPGAADGTLTFGYAPYDGSEKSEQSIYTHMMENSYTNAASIPLKNFNLKKGCIYACLDNPEKKISDTAFYRHAPYRKLSIPAPEIRIAHEEKTENGVIITAVSGTFAHAVSFINPGKGIPEDCYFDLLPGKEKKVFIRNGKPGIKAEAVSL